MISKKKIEAINRASFVLEALEEVHPQYSRSGSKAGEPWWNEPPENWNRDERELWDLLHETEHKLRSEILRILSNGSAEK